MTAVDGVVRLLPEVERTLTTQEYAAASALDGVWHRPLVKHRSTNGWFLELLRVTDGQVDHLPAEAGAFAIRQLSLSHAAPGRLNAFHLHPNRRQDELWIVLQGQLAVWLVDCRADSPTARRKQRFILSAEQPSQLYIPTGVAHGYRAGSDGALLAYVMNDQFAPERANEGRLPWDYFGAELWMEDRG